MREAVISILIGYLLGSVSPAAFFASLKNKDLRSTGTKNLGATNVTISLGKLYGLIVMALDIAKSFAAVKIVRLLFPAFPLAALIAGCGAVLGHVFPIYMKFKGGKGLAAYGGMILALDPGLFLILLAIGLSVIYLTNYAIALTFSTALFAPIIGGLRAGSFSVFLFMLFPSLLIIFKHLENLGRIKEGTEIKARDFLSGKIKRD